MSDQSARRPTFEDLVTIMARLRGPGGCPWDRQQTHRSLGPYLLEETYETLEAIDAGAPDRLREELGDLLLQVVFHAQMAAETGTFTIEDIVAGLAEKLIRRHPHVFGETQATGADAVLANWEAIKEAERAGVQEGHADATGGDRSAESGGGALDGLPRTLPALMLAQQMQERAARVGFAWPSPREVIDRIRGDLTKIEHAAAGGPRERIADEIGDLLFTLAHLPRSLGVDGEQALRAACQKFRERFARLEDAARVQGRPLSACTADELLDLWRASR